MADWQHRFLSSVILNQEIKEAVSAGITPAFLRDPQYATIYQYLIDHYNTYGSPPDEQVVSHAFPTQRWEPQGQPLSFLMDRIRSDRKLVLLMEGLSQAGNFVGQDKPDEIESALQDALIQARTETSAALDADFTTSRAEIEEGLIERMDNPGRLRGISTGFNGIDFVTGGLQPEQYVVLMGTPKSYKSATLLAMARAVHQQGKVSLFVGFEMSNIEQQDRLVSLYSGVSLSKITSGRLNRREFEKVSEAMAMVEGMRPFIFSTDIRSATTVSGLQAKIQNYNPDVLFVDGAYLMQSELEKVEPGSAQALTNISRSLKRLAQAQKIPVVITTQASLTRSKGGLSIGSAMYTQAWGQDCDVMMGVERVIPDKGEEEPEELGGPVTVKFKVVESRSGPRKTVMLEWDWAHGDVSEIDMAALRAALDPRNKRNLYED
jgi:replicative DNA helicase